MAAHATATALSSQPTGQILREWLRRERLEKMPTVDAVPAVPPSPPILKRRTTSLVPLESQRPCLKIVNPDVDTISLVVEALERFHLAYPGITPEIVLGRALRYLEMWVSGPRLPYIYELGDYDVIIRAREIGPDQAEGSGLC